jgi:SAM-dependent methyltransferase
MTNLKDAARTSVKRSWRRGSSFLPARLREPTRVAARRVARRLGLLAPRPAPERPAPPTMRDPAECPVCGSVADGFLPFGMVRPKPERRCPTCGSLERHRLIWLYFQRKTNLFTDPVKMLHIAPEAFVQERLRSFGNIDYLSADLASPRAMVKMDITDIQYPDSSFDVVFASHVLEHIPDDVQAMRELRRVLRPDGWAVLQVPMWGPRTKEDPTVTDPAERARLFGQDDHVRMYGHDGEYERRLRRAGFDVTVERFTAELGPEQTHRYRLLETEDVYLCRKGEGSSDEVAGATASKEG